MENVQVEFQLELDKEIYGVTSWKTREEFFDHLVVNYIADDIGLIERSLDKKEVSEQKRYEGFIKTYEELQDNIRSSIKYDLEDTKGNTEYVNVSFNYTYYDNPIRTKEEIVLYDIFNKNIQSNIFLARDLPRMAVAAGGSANHDIVKSAMAMYSHVSSMLAKAKETIKINGISIVVEKNTNKMKIQ